MPTPTVRLGALLLSVIPTGQARAQDEDVTLRAGVEEELEDEDEDVRYFPWTVQVGAASQTAARKVLTLHVLADCSENSQVGFAYATGNEALGAFRERGLYWAYNSDRVNFQMYSAQYQYNITKNFWYALNVGRFEVHDAMKISTAAPTDILYLSTSGNAIAIDIEKNYLSFSMGVQFKIMPYVSLGLIAFEYVIKGDSSGVTVDAVNGVNESERRRIHAEMVSYARSDYFLSPQIMLRFDF